MEQEIGSITGYCYSKWPVTVYEDAVPQNFAVPSMYFPSPIVVPGNDSVSTFLTSYTINIKIFHTSSQEAVKKGNELLKGIYKARNLIPLLNEDGSAAGGYIRIKKGEVREIDDCVAQLQLSWDSRYSYDKDNTAPLMGKVYVKGGLKIG